MVETYRRRSALAHFGLSARAAQTRHEGADIVMGEKAHRSLVDIRGEIADSSFRDAVARIVGAEPPRIANTAVDAGARRIMWMGPNEWLIVAPNGEAGSLVSQLRREFGANHASAVDVSESRTVITLAGPKAREFLARGVTLDLHPRAFKVGQCAQTGMSRCNILLHLIDDRPSFDIYVLKSFADYLWQWSERAAAQFRIAVAD
jgi:sarcosine oxidase subunit gamma